MPNSFEPVSVGFSLFSGRAAHQGLYLAYLTVYLYQAVCHEFCWAELSLDFYVHKNSEVFIRLAQTTTTTMSSQNFSSSMTVYTCPSLGRVS